MNKEEQFNCPHCGVPISKCDSFCKNCGANIEVWTSNFPLSKTNSDTAYARRFSPTRLFKILYSPRDVMKDIASALDYEGVILLLILEGVISLVAIFMAFQKIQFVGKYANQIGILVTSILAFSVVLAVVVVFVRWLIKSLIVRYVLVEAMFGILKRWLR